MAEIVDGSKGDLAPASPRRRWAVIGLNVLLAAVIVGLLVATWMPAIYSARPAASQPVP